MPKTKTTKTKPVADVLTKTKPITEHFNPLAGRLSKHVYQSPSRRNPLNEITNTPPKKRVVNLIDLTKSSPIVIAAGGQLSQDLSSGKQLNENANISTSFFPKNNQTAGMIGLDAANTEDSQFLLNLERIESIEKSDSGQKPPIKKVKLVVASTASSAPSFSKTMEKSAHVAIKSTRERVAKHEGVKSVSVDQFSIVLYRFINVTRDLALKPIKGFAKTFKIPFTVSNGNLVLNPLSKSARASLIDLLKERMELYDVGVSVDLVESLLDPTKWITYADYFVCLDVGEVMNPRGKLIGSLQGGKVCMTFGNSRPQRSHIVLLASGQPRPSPQHTADHLIPSEPLNDSIANLRWATRSQQNLNQGAHVASKTFKTFTGTLLPPHPNWGQRIKLTSNGLVKVANRDWTYGREAKTGNFSIELDRSTISIHVLMVESILGRLLTDAESVDHISGDHSANALSNLAPLFQVDNSMKSTVKLVTRINSSGKSVVFGGLYLAAESVPGSNAGAITNCLTGDRSSHNSHQWKDASEEDVNFFFNKMDEIDTTKSEWPELSKSSRYPNLLKSIALFKEWETALSNYYSSL